MYRHSRSLQLVAVVALFPALAAAQQRTTAATANWTPVDTTAWSGLEWRLLGPAHTGRMTSVAGSSQRPNEYYVGTTGGGVWKTIDGGKTWNPMSDDYFGGTIGAVDVFKANPDIVWAGGGETPIRGNVSHGDGVWKTADAGKTWQKILFKNDSTGIADLVMDPTNPDVLYAGFWQAGRKPWLLVSGGAGSGIWKTTDGGNHWTEITHRPGLPPGIWGNIGIAISPAKPSRVWALIEADSGGVYRSDDAGATWQFLSGDRNLRQRAWYFSKLFADPKDTNVVYGGNVGGYISHDGGKTFQSGLGNGDTHYYWIDPADSKRIAVAGDPGVVMTTDGGKTTVRANIPTGQYYHVHLTNAVPYDVCGAEQDGGVDCFPIREAGGRGGRGGAAGAPAGGRGGATSTATPPSQWNFTQRYGGAGGESG